ncbi:hypothetical protein I8752_19060 [Nostocaceae cyanobacterium CENA369]|uniref:Uncharacterized protein n=1 Tax=Dendronalium phyllosphericum CENA369 TaxID=1725256 RepID=A0A8J7LEM1_9NOST|nr:hypothetical protein [Dendronalium phyllosphericum]MBH8575077.1 hypothetical protein [Dendronalium phyllosphericum CENA369]
MEIVLVFFGCIFFAIIYVVLVQFTQGKEINKIENEQLKPVLENLYNNPKCVSQHKEFLVKLKGIDLKLDKFKESKLVYSPSENILKLLIKHLDKYPIDTLAHERFMNLVDRANQINEPGFKLLIQHLERNFDHPSANERFAQCINNSQFLTVVIFEPLLKYLDKYPTDPLVHKVFIQGVNKIILSGNNLSGRAYTKSLEILEKNSNNINAKKFVLDVGRWHFGKLRSGKVTIYDEQAIQNDIAVRSSQ